MLYRTVKDDKAPKEPKDRSLQLKTNPFEVFKYEDEKDVLPFLKE